MVVLPVNLLNENRPNQNVKVTVNNSLNLTISKETENNIYKIYLMKIQKL